MSESRQFRNRRSWASGLVLVVVFIGIVIGGVYLSSAVQRTRIAIDRTNDIGNLKLMVIAVLNYRDTYGQFPPPYFADASGRHAHSWRVILLPFLNEQKLYEEYRFSEPWNGPNNRKLATRMPRVFAFHGMEMVGNTTTNFVAVVGQETVWSGQSKVTLDDVQDPLEDTILFVENYGADIHWMEPRDLKFQEMDFTWNSPLGVSSWHLDPKVVALDGDVKRLGREITPATLRALLTINGQEDIQQDADRNWLPSSE